MLPFFYYQRLSLATVSLITLNLCVTLTHTSNRALMMASQSNLADEIVTIKVGSGNEQTTFQWLKSILEYHSPFFVGALERSFKEAETREIELPEDDVDVFAEFLGWTTDHDCKLKLHRLHFHSMHYMLTQVFSELLRPRH